MVGFASLSPPKAIAIFRRFIRKQTQRHLLNNKRGYSACKRDTISFALMCIIVVVPAEPLRKEEMHENKKGICRPGQ